MLELEFIHVLSVLFTVGVIGAFSMTVFFGKKRRNLGSVKASKPNDFVTQGVWFLLIFPFLTVFFLIGATIPSWVYGTILNVSFQGAEVLQVVSTPLFLIGLVLCGWSDKVLGQFMTPRIAVMQKHELVTRGPYSRVRHPKYTGVLLMILGGALLFLNVIIAIDFLVILTIAYQRAVLEEELLASEDGFGQEYRDYMKRTGRFLPRL